MIQVSNDSGSFGIIDRFLLWVPGLSESTVDCDLMSEPGTHVSGELLRGSWGATEKQLSKI
jgi:hypothetical protein